jgi:3-oxoacyl-[acyl-carrier protein] reductase
MPDRPVAIITGAGSGIGAEVCRHLGGEGWRLSLVGRTREKLDATAESLPPTAGPTRIIAADVATAPDCRRIVDETVEHLGRVDALVNVAGFASLTPIDRITPDDWRQTIDINLSSIVLLTAAAWPHLKATRGIVVNVSSLASVDPFPHFAMYAAAKAAVNLFTRCTANEGARLGVRAVAVAPGAVETPMLRGLFSEKAIPPHRTLSPRQVAAVIGDCITGQRAFKSGETILVRSE